MTRKITLAAVLALLLAPQTFAGTWHKSVAAAQKVAREKNQLILIDMFAQWCGWCHRFEREVFPSAVFQAATKDIVLLRLDTEDGKEGTEYSRKFGVTSLPTFVLVTHDLSIAGLIRGYAPPTDFVKSLKDTRTKYDDFLKRAKNEASFAKDPVQRLALAKEYVTRGAYDKGELRLRKLITEKNIPVVIRDEAYYHLALSFTVQNKFNEALKTIRELTSHSKVGESVERARILAGQIYMQQGNWLNAANEFRSFKTTYPNSPLIRTVDSVLPGIEKRLAMGR
ncbi:MAG TPA: thioredoxin family protein [Thermoanaerobaculia bacterium]|nr:thioredoxin family protein [Thermoanaerobaculia bacterium]